MLSCGDPSFWGVPCMAALIAAILSLFLSGVIAASVLPAAINMPWNVLPTCLLNSSMSGTAIVSSPSMKTSGIFSFGTALLNEMESVIGPSFKKVKSLCYREHKHGFYVYAKPNLRYGRLYARHRKTDSSLSHAIPKQKHRIYRSFNQWRTAILTSFGYDPLECPACGHKMELLELYYNHKRVSLEELYERTMSKSPGKYSSA